jgi:metal-responsive CopG/Arc/MetJ family transcriptional regulator
MKEGGVSLKLQRKIIDEIDRTIKEHPEFFYRTRTDLVCDAIRRHLQNISGGCK